MYFSFCLVLCFRFKNASVGKCVLLNTLVFYFILFSSLIPFPSFISVTQVASLHLEFTAFLF